MKYKTPALPKVESHASEMKFDIDTKGYHTRPINIVNATGYVSRNAAVPYFENIDTSMIENNKYGLEDVLDFEGETDIISAGKFPKN